MTATLFGNKRISTISYSNDEIIKDIMSLYGIKRFDLDCTYSKGVFWERLPQPKHKTDIEPQTKDTIKANSEELPFDNSSLESVMFDPPFLAGLYNKKGRMFDRFSGFRRMTDLWEYYRKSIFEIYRVLDEEGILVFKCQDVVSENKQWFSHSYIMNVAIEAGFYPQDLFILLSKHRMVGANHQRQFHARKFHSYFWVLRKTKTLVNYDT
jgi:hypothetical protein